MMYTPVIVPIHTEPSRCPSCRHDEETKTVCKHCNYEYPESGMTATDLGVVIVVIAVSIWFVLTIFTWLATSTYENTTLAEVLQWQWNWLTSLRLW